jgi:hypothetical protein
MRDLPLLAELSHAIDRLAMALCLDGSDDRTIETKLIELAEGERETVAMALAYALRRRELAGSDPVNDRAIAVVAEVVRRMVHHPGSESGAEA